jgi:hypothetical protein
VSRMRYELGFYIPEDVILHGHRRENLKSYIALTGWALYRRRNVSPMRYELGFYIPEDAILHSHHRENLKSYTVSQIGHSKRYTLHMTAFSPLCMYLAPNSQKFIPGKIFGIKVRANKRYAFYFEYILCYSCSFLNSLVQIIEVSNIFMIMI